MSDRELEQETLEGDERMRTSVRMSVRERESVVARFGGIQPAWDSLVKIAEKDEGWIPDLPRRLVPAYRAIRDAGLEREAQIVDSGKLRESVMNACNCTRRTAISHLHELKDRSLLFTIGAWGDEMIHFVACSAADVEKVRTYGKKR